MNKTALKNFATNARRELIKKVEAKALKIGITEENIKKAQIESSDAIYINGKQLTITEKKQRDKLIQRIKDIGFKQVVEEVAYTWFNRFIALRFMEVNNYLPTKVRVLSSSNPDSPEPDILKEALSVDLDIDKELVYELKLNNKTEELYKYLIIKQCNSLNKYLPFLFETIEDYKEILFPEGLLAKDSFLREMTDTDKIPESDWEQVEIIGWLYQYYIAEEKDRVIKAKKKYKKEEIPFATQLFTPDWIVRYMVQNTLGRYWVESHPEHRDLIKNWEFYLENPNPEPDFEEKLAPFINKELKVEDIKCFDPAMGSGHILVYMFEVLFQIYSRCGYMEREIPRLIIENNLFGLDIDDRAYQLACFSVVMKALEYNKRFLRSIERDGLMLNLASLQETNGLTDDEIAYLAGDSVGERFEKMKTFILQFKNAKAIGSLIKIESYDQEFLQQRLKTIEQQAGDLFEIEMKDRILPLYKKIIKQASLMTQQYDIFITNPPYAGNKYLPVEVSTYLKRKYPDVKSDLFSAFIEYSFTMTKENGQMGFMTPFVWMFISSYEKLRQNIINNRTISSLIQLEYSGFDEATVPICTFTLKNYYSNTTGEYIKLSDFKGSRIQPVKTLEAINNPEVAYRYSVSQRDFITLPGNTIAYWLERDLKELFKNYKTIGDDYIVRKGLSTGNNEKFLRFWYEVDFNKINFNFTDINEVYHVKDVWVPYIKGGKYQKWFGNLEYVLRFGELNISEMSRCPGHRFDGKDYYFKESLTWSAVTSGKFSMRYVPKGFAFDQKGPILTSNEKDLYTLLGFMNSTIVQDLLDAISPTLDYSQGPISKIPSISLKNETKLEINKLVRRNIEIAQELFSLYEENWYFKKHFLLKDSNTLLSENIKISSKSLEDLSNELIHNEQKINNLLKMELNINKTEMIKENNIFTDAVHYVKESILSFISYAIGCIFGRYSLDEDGLVYAGGKFDPGRYQKYPVDKDNILPILSEAYFEDDIVSRFVEFVKVTFGEETLEENLEFIADTLGKRNGETARETIRRYFLNDFFKDHVQTYKKRPIYWLFTSGKQKAFNCLIYMHRYDKTTLSRIRTDYLHPLQMRLDAERKSLLEVIEGGGTAKEISNAKKELKQLDLKIEELKVYDELLHHMADMQIEIDLDDGVAVNYAKFNGLLAKLD